MGRSSDSNRAVAIAAQPGGFPRFAGTPRAALGTIPSDRDTPRGPAQRGGRLGPAARYCGLGAVAVADGSRGTQRPAVANRGTDRIPGAHADAAATHARPRYPAVLWPGRPALHSHRAARAGGQRVAFPRGRRGTADAAQYVLAGDAGPLRQPVLCARSRRGGRAHRLCGCHRAVSAVGQDVSICARIRARPVGAQFPDGAVGRCGDRSDGAHPATRSAAGGRAQLALGAGVLATVGCVPHLLRHAADCGTRGMAQHGPASQLGRCRAGGDGILVRHPARVSARSRR
eukprot:ctg_698.g331